MTPMKCPLKTTLLLLLSLGALLACHAREAAPSDTAKILSEATALGIANPRAPLPGILTAGKLTREQMTGLVGAGYRTFVDLRSAKEKGAGEEAGWAGELRATYASIDVAGPEDLTEEHARLLDTLVTSADGPVVVYCASGNRAGAMLALRAWCVQGMSPEDALALGREAGLTRMEPALKERLGL